jgi:acetyl esterase/lipase
MMKKYVEKPTFETLLELQKDTRAEAAADARQAVRYLRDHASEYGIDPTRIGMMGFSAGAMTTMSALHGADDAERPNIAAPIYGAMVESGAPAKAPPIFIAVAADDKTTPASMSTDMFAAWKSAGASVEMHIFETGDHGFGLGRPGTSSMEWPAVFEVWLKARGFIAPG